MITETQEAILDYIRAYQVREGMPPSSRLIKVHFKWGSQTTAVRHLKSLAAKGLLEQFADGRWGIKNKTAPSQFQEIQVYGSIPAGSPAFTEQETEGSLPLDLKMLGAKGPVWAVRVTGDSMTGAHIAEGDIAILEKREARSGDVIAALVDDTSTTLKRFLLENGRPVLRAENPRYADIRPTTLECQGVLVAVFRQHLSSGRRRSA